MEDATTELPPVEERVENGNGELTAVEEAVPAIDADEEPTSTITAVDEPAAAADDEEEVIVAATDEEVELPPPRLMITKMVSYHLAPRCICFIVEISRRHILTTVTYH